MIVRTNFIMVFLSSLATIKFVHTRPINDDVISDPWFKIAKASSDRGEVTELDIIPDEEYHRSKRAVFADARRKWTGGVVPYVFDRIQQPITYGAEILIRQAMSHIEEKTCVRFVARTTENRYVNFTKGNACSSYIGRTSLVGQEINIGENCENLAVIVHEIMHALGFFHEHSRLDRDEYVVINYTNIFPRAVKQFNTYTSHTQEDITTLNLPYDKQSVMHYSRFIFSVHVNPITNQIENKREYMTIYSRSNYREVLGNRIGLSSIDVRKIKKHYNCPEIVTTTTTTSPRTPTPKTTMTTATSTTPVTITSPTTTTSPATITSSTTPTLKTTTTSATITTPETTAATTESSTSLKTTSTTDGDSKTSNPTTTKDISNADQTILEDQSTTADPNSATSLQQHMSLIFIIVLLMVYNVY